MRIAFIANNRSPRLFRRNPSFIYRCENPATWLADQGHDVSLCHIKHAPFPREVDAAVFHRPRSSIGLRWLLRQYRWAGVKILADFDDLIFNEADVRHSPAIRNKRLPLLILWRIFRLHRQAMGWFDRITVSTQALADAVHGIYPDVSVTVLANSIHWAWRKDVSLVPRECSGPRVLAYLPGTHSHDRDFAEIAPSLERFLRNHPDTLLKITGPLKFDLNLPVGQVIHEERVPFDQYPQRFAGIWVNLAPLEETPFNACKSALKAMEAGFMGVPTLYSNNPDMDRLAGEGVYRVEDGDWYGALERLRDPVCYAAAVANLRERVLPLADVAKQGEGLLTLLQASAVWEPL